MGQSDTKFRYGTMSQITMSQTNNTHLHLALGKEYNYKLLQEWCKNDCRCPSMPFTLENAKYALITQRPSKSTWDKYSVNIVSQLCSEYNVPVVSTGKTARFKTLKSDYVNALLQYVSKILISACSTYRS